MAYNTPHYSWFHIEIETTIKGQSDPPGDSETDKWRSVVGPLSEALAESRMPNHITLAEDKEDETYKEWYITQDKTISTQADPSRWGVKLVSQTFEYNEEFRDDWQGNIYGVYSNLNYNPFRGEPNDTCALQVHISLSQGWNVKNVRWLAQAIAFYKPQFEKLAASVGRGDPVKTPWARVNSVKVGDDANPSWEVIKAHLESLDTVEKIVEAVCPKDGAQVAPTHYFWNLWPLVGLEPGENGNVHGASVKKTGTVELRLPPSPGGDKRMRALRAYRWVDLANLFVLAATDPVGYAGGIGKSGLISFVVAQGTQHKVDDTELQHVVGLLM